LSFNTSDGLVFNIFRINSDGSGLMQLTFFTTPVVGGLSPDWQPVIVIQPAVHPLNVGGEMLLVDLLRVLAPWIAMILALTVVAVETLVIRTKNRKP